MNSLLFQVALGVMLAPPPGVVDGKTVVNLLESIQPQLRDFRCEFEGTQVQTTREAKERLKLGEDGLAVSFGGVFIWKANGDTYLDSYHREEPEGKVLREQLAVRMAKRESEFYKGYIDNQFGKGFIDDPDFQTSDRLGSYGSLLTLDKVRGLVSAGGHYCTMTDEVLETRRVKVLTFLRHNDDQPFQRYWIDLKRGGHAVREELYLKGGALWLRRDIKLASFRVGEGEIWMPIHGVFQSHLVAENGKPVFREAPTSTSTIYVIQGTIEFNRHPGPKTFEIAYKPGTPISDKLRKLEFEFGQQKQPPLPSLKEAAKMLRAQLAEAETQREDLVAGSPARDSTGWTSWLTPALVGSTLVLSIVLLVRQHRR